MAPIYTLFHGQEDNRPTQSPSGSHGGLVLEWPLYYAAQTVNEMKTRTVRKETKDNLFSIKPFFSAEGQYGSDKYTFICHFLVITALT